MQTKTLVYIICFLVGLNLSYLGYVSFKVVQIVHSIQQGNKNIEFEDASDIGPEINSKPPNFNTINHIDPTLKIDLRRF